MSGAGGSPRLASIHLYPLKAGRAVDLAESVIEPWGLAGDRRWLVVDSAGRFVSQREEPALARVTAAYPAAGTGHAAGGLPPMTERDEQGFPEPPRATRPRPCWIPWIGRGPAALTVRPRCDPGAAPRGSRSGPGSRRRW